MSELRLVEPAPEGTPGANSTALDECFTISLFGRTYYLRVCIGTEQRSQQRLTINWLRHDRRGCRGKASG